MRSACATDPVRPRRDARSCRYDQAQPDALLEVANLQAHRWLRQAELARGCREAAQLGNCGQRAKLVKVEAAHLKALLIDPIRTTDYRQQTSACKRRR
jgi:hypothetical protein